MRVLFTHPDFMTHRMDWPGHFYSGVAQLSSVLKLHGHQIKLIHVVKPMEDDEFLSRVREFDPQLVCFTGTSSYARAVDRFSMILVKGGVEAPKIVGGIHATVRPEECIRMQGIDIVCLGEGERPLVELCELLERGTDTSNIQNLWIKRNGRVTKNPLRPPIRALDSLPFPDRSIYDNYSGLYLERQHMMSMQASRGCPYNCSYCSNKILRDILGTKEMPIRFRSPKHVIDEIKEVRETYPFLDKVDFDDDILFFSKSWAEEFTELYLEEVRLPFVCNGRANLLNEEAIKLLKKAGCFHLKIGLESGNEDISNKIMKRNISNDQLRNAFRLSRQSGLRTESFNMVGLPEETPSKILDTIKLNAELKTNQMQVTIYQPFPGTDLYDYCKEKGYLPGDGTVSDIFHGSILNLPSVTESQIRMFRDYFKVFVALYRIALNLGIFERAVTQLADALLAKEATSRILNWAYHPMNYVFRKIQLARNTKCSWVFTRSKNRGDDPSTFRPPQ